MPLGGAHNPILSAGALQHDRIVTVRASRYKLIAPRFTGAISFFLEGEMNEMNGNGRDSIDQRVEQLFHEGGIALGRVLDERQSNAVQLAIQMFAYLIACLHGDALSHNDVIQLLKVYSRGINHAKNK